MTARRPPVGGNGDQRLAGGARRRATDAVAAYPAGGRGIGRMRILGPRTDAEERNLRTPAARRYEGRARSLPGGRCRRERTWAIRPAVAFPGVDRVALSQEIVETNFDLYKRITDDPEFGRAGRPVRRHPIWLPMTTIKRRAAVSASRPSIDVNAHTQAPGDGHAVGVVE